MIIDTDVIIWTMRGNSRAAQLIEKDTNRCISIISYMELLQGAKNKDHHRIIKNFLKECTFTLFPVSDKIGNRASVYIEEYSLSHGLRVADALVAATAVENNMKLCSANNKHYKFIKELDLKILKI